MIKKTAMILFGLMVSFCSLAQPVNSLVHNNLSLVDDYANIYTPEEEKELYDKILKPFFDTVQIVVVTVNSLDGMDKADYATKLFNRWGVGSKSNNGLLLLIAPTERKAFAATGKGIQGELTDLQAAKLQRELMTPEFKNKKYFEGTRKVLLAYIDVLSPSAKEYREKQQAATDLRTKKQVSGLLNVLGFIVVFGIGSAIILLSIRSYRRAKSKKREQESNIEWERSRNIMKLIQLINMINYKYSGAPASLISDVNNLHNEMEATQTTEEMKVANKRFDEFMMLNIEAITSYKKNVDVYSSATSEYITSKNLSKECDSIITGLIDKCSNLVFASSASLLDTLKHLRIEFTEALDKLGKSLSEGTPSLSTQIVYNRAVELKRKRTLFISQRDFIKNTIKEDYNKCVVAQNGYTELNKKATDLLTYCYKSGVGENAIAITKDAIAKVKQRLESSSYHRMSIVWQYELYIELEQLLSSKDCQLAKTEYEKAEAIKRKRIQEQIEEDKRKANKKRQEQHDSYFAGYASSSSRSDSSSSNYSSYSSGSSSSSSSSDLGGGSSDGGGGGSDW